MDNIEQIHAMDAYRKATEGLSEQDKEAFVAYGQLLLQLPKILREKKAERAIYERNLDAELAENVKILIRNESVIIVDDFVNRTCLSEYVLEQKIRQHKIFRIPEHLMRDGSPDYYPAFLADSKYELSSLESISKSLKKLNGIIKYRFFTTPNSTLEDKTPLDALLDDKLELVLAAAKNFRKIYIT